MTPPGILAGDLVFGLVLGVVFPRLMRRACTTFAPRSRVAVAAGLAVAALALPATAAAHDGGRAEPVASLVVRESGPLQALIDLRVRDEDGGEPVRAADVEGFGVMTRPHTMYTYFGPLPEVSPGRYRARVTLPMAARWSLSITIGGRSIVTRTVKASLVIDRTALTERTTPATEAAVDASSHQPAAPRDRRHSARRRLTALVSERRFSSRA